MTRRTVAALAVAAALAAPGAAGAGTSKDAAAWAKPQIERVVKAGLMGPSVEAFRGADPLDEGTLESIVTALNATFAPLAGPPAPVPTTTTTPPTTTTGIPTTTWTVTTTTVGTGTTAVTTTVPTVSTPGPLPAWKPSSWRATSPGRAVTVAQFDRVLVDVLGLSASAKRVRTELVRAGLRPPARAGTETVARLLGLRTNHPSGRDDLELLPEQPITRAEAAFSVAEALGIDRARRDWAAQAAAVFALPDLTPWQQALLTTAVGYVGYPYVWGGTSPLAESPFGVQAAGGFDCSGFVWRVVKLTPYAGGEALAGVLRGRTTYEMAGEVPRKERIASLDALEPGDVLFFGRGPKSKPAEIGHTGIYLGDGWMVHSSRYGTTIAPLDGWYRTSFAWARRPLREAGLAS